MMTTFRCIAIMVLALFPLLSFAQSDTSQTQILKNFDLLPSSWREADEQARDQNFFIERRKATGEIKLSPEQELKLKLGEQKSKEHPLFRKGNAFDGIGNGAGGGSREGATFSVGTGTRGGGSGVQCSSSGSVEILDLYLARRSLEHLPATDIHLEKLGQNPTDFARDLVLRAVLERVETRLPSLAQRLRRVTQELSFKNWQRSTGPLPHVEDFNSEFQLESGWRRVQLAYRRSNLVVFDHMVYERMRGVDRAALMLHEAIYALSGQTTSKQVRNITSLIFSKSMQNQTTKELMSVLEQNGIATDLTRFALPEGVSFKPSKPRDKIRCASLIYAQPRTEEKFVGFSVRFSLMHASFTHDDITREIQETGSVIPYFDQTAGVLTDVKSGIRILESMRNAKFYLQNKYPLYRYPAQSFAAEILCVDEKGPVSLELALFTNDNLSYREKHLAELEIEYMATRDPSRLKMIEAVFREERNKIASDRKTDPLNAYWSLRSASRKLESVTLFFEPRGTWNQHIYIESDGKRIRL